MTIISASPTALSTIPTVTNVRVDAESYSVNTLEQNVKVEINE